MATIDKLVKKARPHLDADERIGPVVYGAYETEMFGQDTVRNGVMLATDRRLFFYAKKLGGHQTESFPYGNISSIEAGKNLMGGAVSFFASGNKVSMKWIQAGDLDGLVNTVRSRMGERKAPEAAPAAPDFAAQIEKLADLHARGLLTDAEFSDKKAEILSRL